MTCGKMLYCEKLLCFIGFIVINFVTSGATLRFVNEPQSVTVKAGAGIELICQTEPREGVDVRWRLNGSPFVSDLTRGIVARAGRLQITNVTLSLAGSYDCAANNSRGIVISQPADVRIAEQWNFPSGLKDVQINVTEGNVALIPCSPPQGVPPPTILFDFNGKPLDSSTGRYFVLPSGNLQIQGVRASDQGIYKCVAVNPISGQKVVAENSVHLRVTTPLTRVPTRLVHQPPERVEVELGQMLVLECVVEGSPVPVVTWYKHGGYLPEGRFEKNLGNLFIYNVEPFDHGNYICRADNGAPPHQAAVAVVDVLEKPSVRIAASTQRVVEGSPVRLECHAHGKPLVYIKWLHNGDDVGLDTTIISTDQTLTIDVAQFHHSGYYQCVASNRLGVAYATALLEILPKNSKPAPVPSQPKIPTESPPTRRPSQDRFKTSTTPAMVDNHSPMLDMSDVAGTMNGDEDFLEEDEDMDVDIPGPTDGQRPKKKPTEDGNKVMIPPSRPEVAQRSESSVMVKWSVPDNNGLRITFFRIQYKDVRGTGRWQTIEHDILPAVREYEVTGLEPGATYRFRVMAVFSNLDNRPSDTSTRITLADGDGGVALVSPDGLLLIVEVKALSVDSLAIRWQYVPSGPVEGFYVYYKLYSFPGNYQRETVVGSHLRYHILRGLQPGAEYSLRMQCFNMAGTGDFSNTVVRRTSASHEVNDDGTALVDELYPDERWPRGHPPSMVTPPTPPSDKVPVEGQQGNDTLYLVLGVVLGVMVIVLLIFVVMCGMRQVHQRKQMAAMVNGKFYETAPMMQHNTMLAKQNPQLQVNGFAAPPAPNSQTMTLTNRWLAPDSDGKLTISVNPMSEMDNSSLRTVDSKAYQTIQSVADQPQQAAGMSNNSAPPPLPPHPRTRPNYYPPPIAPAYGSTSSAQSTTSYNVLDAAYCGDNSPPVYQQQQSMPYQPPYTGVIVPSYHQRHPMRDRGMCTGPHHHVSGNAEPIYSGSTCGDGCEPLNGGDYLCVDCQECPDCYSSHPSSHPAWAHRLTHMPPPPPPQASTNSSRSSAGSHNAAALVLQNIDNATRERGADSVPDGFFQSPAAVRYPPYNANMVLGGHHLVAPYKSAQPQALQRTHHHGQGSRRPDMPSVNDYSASDNDEDAY